MSILKKLPWLSLILLLLTFTSLGWVISSSNPAIYVWLLVAIAILFLTGSLTSRWANLRNYSYQLFRTKIKSFAFAILASLLLFLILARFRLFLDILLILAASMLVRLDLQTAGFRDETVFLITTTFSLTGLGLGVLLQKLMSHYL